MHVGYLLEYGDSNFRTAAQWVSGAPEDSAFQGANLKGRQQYTIQAFRCGKCGFLESYALPGSQGDA
jgi:hypothetical protein